MKVRKEPQASVSMQPLLGALPRNDIAVELNGSPVRICQHSEDPASRLRLMRVLSLDTASTP